ncbi:MAG: outer membrane lipoprotein carrier protein LolA [Spirochaetales bacterium]|jgi:hypothetical protein|nr:outer membrane lipoprotein carrier protein LolA [Spirochaetales bacterium]
MSRFTCFFAVCIALLGGAPLYPQTPPDNPVFQFPLSPATLPRFHEICGVLAKRPVTKGIFTQKKNISRLNRSLVSGGNFIIDAKLGIVWETLSPFPSTMAVGRDYIIQSVPGGAKTKLEAAGNETFLRLSETLSAVFTGDAQRLLENFKNYFTETGAAWTLGLIPLEGSIRSFAAAIIMSGDSVIRSVTVHEQNGDSIRYELSRHSFPEELGSHEKNLFSAH